MKKIIYNMFSASVLLLLTLFAGMLMQSCEKFNDDSQKMPEVSYIRVCDPAKSDSLIGHSYMGNNLAIIGNHLKDVDEIWFNDQSASLNPNLVLDNSIIVMIPSVIPTKVTNKMMLINRNKADTLKYDFVVDVPAPLVSNMVCEWVPDGKTAVINGNYFVDNANSPLKVFFPGNIEGTIVSSTLSQIKVTVPTGIIGSGPITVKSLYGSTRSVFYFRDDRYMIVNFDDLTAAGGWRSGKIANTSPDPISGNFVRFSGALAGKAGTTWDEDNFSFDYWPSANGRSNAAIYPGDFTKAEIEFEVNVVSAWKSCALQMIFTPYSLSGTNSYIADKTVPRGLWIPWKATGSYTTDGWITVRVPLSDFNYTYEGLSCVNSLTADMIRGLTMYVWNGGVDGVDCNPNICIDNVRIVPAE
jgi:hypothetical protein